MQILRSAYCKKAVSGELTKDSRLSESFVANGGILGTDVWMCSPAYWSWEQTRISFLGDLEHQRRCLKGRPLKKNFALVRCITCLQTLHKTPFCWLIFVSDFLTGNKGVRIGKSLHGTITPAVLRDSKNGVMPSMASCLSGYWALQGLKSDFGVMTTGSQSLMRPTSYLLTAHSVIGRVCPLSLPAAYTPGPPPGGV